MHATQPQMHSGQPRAPAGQPPHTLLLCIPRDLTRDTLSFALRSRGYIVLCASDPNQTIGQLVHQPDLAVVEDDEMDPTAWRRAVQRIREALPTTWILLLADFASRPQVAEALQSGVSHIFLRRGFNLDKFFEVVDRLIRLAPRPTRAGEGRDGRPATSGAYPDATPRPSDAPTPPGSGGQARHPSAAQSGRADQPDEQRTLSAREKLERVLDRITRIKALPTTVAEVLALTGSGYSEYHELVETLRQDAGLSGKVLAVANSSLYRRQRGRITSLDSAVKAIGFKAVREIALGVGIFDLFEPSPKGLVNIRRFWQHSFATASLAHRLAEHCKLENAEEHYIRGLLHDVGTLILDEFFTEGVFRVEADGRNEYRAGPPVEKAYLAIDHARLGYQVMARWQLPSVLTEPIRDHHSLSTVFMESEASLNTNTMILQVADMLAITFGFESGVMDYLMRFSPSVIRLLRLDELNIPQLQERVAGQVEEMKLVMGLYEARKARAAEPPPQPRSAAYFAPGNIPVDIVGVWLQNQPLALRSHVEFVGSAIRPDEAVLVNLWGRAPSEPLAQACLALPAAHCMIICTRDWAELLQPQLPPGWCCATEFVGIACLRTFLGLPDPLADRLNRALQKETRMA